jgi:hypothetical protein
VVEVVRLFAVFHDSRRERQVDFAAEVRENGKQDSAGHNGRALLVLALGSGSPDEPLS